MTQQTKIAYDLPTVPPSCITCDICSMINQGKDCISLVASNRILKNACAIKFRLSYRRYVVAVGWNNQRTGMIPFTARVCGFCVRESLGRKLDIFTDSSFKTGKYRRERSDEIIFPVPSLSLSLSLSFSLFLSRSLSF